MNFSRRDFMGAGAALFAAAGLPAIGAENDNRPKDENGKVISGFDQTDAGKISDSDWTPFSDRKVRVGIAGYGLCKFGALFGYQNHPNVEVVACTDLDPKRCAELQKVVRAPKSYPSCEEMIRHAAEDKLEAVYIATDARSHMRLAIMAVEHGLHVCSAVPAFLGKEQLELIPKLVDAVKQSGRVYAMNETSAFHDDLYAMRKLYEAGFLGAITFSEGEYFHPGGNDPDVRKGKPHDFNSYGAWRWGMPPMYYPTHAMAYYTCVTHKRYTAVTCLGVPSKFYQYRPGNNEYGNVYGSEYAALHAEDGSLSRMAVSFDVPTYYSEGGHIWGNEGSYTVVDKNYYMGWHKDEVKKDPRRWMKPKLPPKMPAGGHGGSHGYLTDDFIRGILVKDHKVCVDLKAALDMTIAGVYSHLSAMKGGELLKIPAVM